MRTLPALALSLAAVCCCGQTQEPSARPADDSLPTFEAASIKPSPPVQRGAILIGAGVPQLGGVQPFRPLPQLQGGPGTNDPGRITCMGCSLSAIIATAHEVELFQIRSGPNFKYGEYDLIAKVPAGSTRHQVNLMLRQLLAERFQLTIHSEKQDMPAYALVVGKQGPKFQQSPGSATEPELSATGAPTLQATLSTNGLYTLTGKHRSMKELADALSHSVHRPVLDMTELEGNYDFSLAWMATERLPPPKRSELPDGIKAVLYSPEDAVRFQLGLKLESRKSLADLLIIDSALEVPIEN
jgi:uncharacterized protein (TIGR03435 family)